METRQIPVKAMVEISSPEGETLRKKGTVGTVDNGRAIIPADEVENWESVPVSLVLEAIEAEKLEEKYKADVVKRIRLRFSADDEAAILRKRIALVGSETEGEDVLNEFLEYNSYAEQCKKEARAAVYGAPDEEINES